MASKIEAARRATLAGADVVVADARVPGVIDAILRGDDVGTLFIASGKKLSAKRYWIAFTLRPRGTLVLDAGAAEAVRTKGRSILPVGVVGVRGDFHAGDAVSIATTDGKEIGRGLARAAVLDAARLAGQGSPTAKARATRRCSCTGMIWRSGEPRLLESGRDGHERRAARAGRNVRGSAVTPCAPTTFDAWLSTSGWTATSMFLPVIAAWH